MNSFHNILKNKLMYEIEKPMFKVKHKTNDGEWKEQKREFDKGAL